MAGLAVVMTFLFFGVVSVAGASIASSVLYFYARKKVSSTGRNPKVVGRTAAAPFIALSWLLAAFILHVVISNEIAHQDCGLGLSPDPWVTLPNGYKLGSHNTYDGYIAAPGVETEQPVVGDGYVRSIFKLKWKDPYFTGSQFDFNTSRIRAFVHDTRSRTTITSDPSLDVNDVTEQGTRNLDAWALAQTANHFDAESYWDMYAQNRKTWPNYLFLTLILLGEGAIALWLRRMWSQPAREAYGSAAK